MRLKKNIRLTESGKKVPKKAIWPNWTTIVE